MAILPLTLTPLYRHQEQGGGTLIAVSSRLLCTTSVIDLRSPANADADTSEEDDDAVASSYWTTARGSEPSAGHGSDFSRAEREFSDALVKSAVAHRLKRNTSSRDFSFTPQQLEDIMIDSLTENRRTNNNMMNKREIIEDKQVVVAVILVVE